jgi:hypothetical protein
MADPETLITLGGEKLDRTLRLFATDRTAASRESVYRAMLDCDLVVPVRELPESLMGVVTEIETEKFPAVPPILDSDGRKGFPLFTTPARLEAFARAMGWSGPDRMQLYVALPSRFAFTVAFSSISTAIVVDPGGPFPFEGTLEEAGTMARGECPNLVPPPPPPAPPVPEPAQEPDPDLPHKSPAPAALQAPESPAAPPPPAGPPAGTAPQRPSFAVPDRLAGVLKVVLEQHPTVTLAVLYEQAHPDGPKLTFGLKFHPATDEVPPPLRKHLSATLKRFLPERETSIEILTDEFENLAMASVKPVYLRTTS